MAERPPKPRQGPARRSLDASRAPAGEPAGEPAQPEGTTPSLTGGPEREYRSGEIEPSQVIQSPQASDGDWEEKTVVDDSQLYNTKEGGPNTLGMGIAAGDEEFTIDEPSRSVSTGLARTMGVGRPAPAPARPAPGRPAPLPARPPAAPTPIAQVSEVAQGKLMVISGNDAGNEYPLHGQTITVGRGIDNDVVLTDIAVSRKHMSISFDGSRYQLSDKGSGNGTIINQRVETGTRMLGHGDRIEIGNTVFRFEHPASQPAPLAAEAAPARPVPTSTIMTGGSPVPPVAPSPGLPLPAVNPPPPASPDRIGLPPPQHHGAGMSAAGAGPVEDAPSERPQPEGAPVPEAPSPWSAPVPEAPSPWSAAPQAPPPAMASTESPEALPAPTYVPLVPRGPISGRKLLVGTAATFVGLIAMAITGMLLGSDESIAQGMEPPVRVEELLLPLLEPLLELGAVTDSLASDVGPETAPDAEPETDPDVEPETDPDVEPETDSEVEPETDPDEIPTDDETAGDQAP